MSVAELDADGIVSHVTESIDSNLRVISVGVASGNHPEKIGFSRLFGTGRVLAQEGRLKIMLASIGPQEGEGISHQLDLGR